MFAKKRSLALILVLAMLLGVFAACSPRGTDDPDDPANGPRPGPNGNVTGDPYALTIADITPDWLFEIEWMYEMNDHTVGWIEIPGTNISDVVLRNPECVNNEYYLRRGFDREFYFNGVYYIDFRADLGPTREYLGINTTIYGHALTDDPADEEFDTKFGNLHKFRDEEFARNHPFIFFSLPEENLVFEIMAVFYGNVFNPAFSYNNNHPNPNDFIYVVENLVIPRSLWIYDVEFDVNDRFLTLSTCIYNPTGGVQLLHWNQTAYRFGIMARLLDPDQPLHEYASFTPNPDRVVDPDGVWRG